MLTKPATTDTPIHELLANRWSPRVFAQNEVSLEDLASLLEAARWAPSAGNGQPWRFMVIPRSDSEGHAKVVSALNPGNVAWAGEAPVFIINIVKHLRDNGAPNPTALYDLGQAVAHLSVQAHARGLHVHQMGGFSREKIRELFNIPEGYEPITITVVGKQGDYDQADESLRERDHQPRTRLDLSQIAFGSTWEAAFLQNEVANK